MSKLPKPIHAVAAKLRGQLVAISDITPDPANLREHDDRSIDAIKASLKRFEQQKPIVIDRRGVVVAGHGTLEAAKRLGWTHIAAVQSSLTGVERVAYAIADNRTPELSRWNTDALAQVLGEMPKEAANAAGFSDDDLADLVGKTDEVKAQDDVAPAPTAEAVSRTGDLWVLGNHRLLCGDSTEPSDVDRLMDGHRAELVATDPPYLVDYTGVRAGNRGKDWSDRYHEIEIVDAAAFFKAVFENVVRVASPNAAIYCWHAHKRLVEIINAWRSLNILDHQQIVWIKPCPVFGSVFWHFRHEPCLMGWLQGNKPTHDGMHDGSSVWTDQGASIPLEQLTRQQLIDIIKAGSSAWEVDWEGKGRPVGNEHPTQKPLELFARPMRKHTARGAVCYEPFSGSGSQIVAAEQVGRRCFAMEIEPVFVDVAVRRWQALTGQSARLLATGQTWQETAACRASPIDLAPSPDATPSPQDDTAKLTPLPSPSPRRGGRQQSQRRSEATEQSGDAYAS